jgi:hypothetical protein
MTSHAPKIVAVARHELHMKRGSRGVAARQRCGSGHGSWESSSGTGNERIAQYIDDRRHLLGPLHALVVQRQFSQGVNQQRLGSGMLQSRNQSIHVEISKVLCLLHGIQINGSTALIHDVLRLRKSLDHRLGVHLIEVVEKAVLGIRDVWCSCSSSLLELQNVVTVRGTSVSGIVSESIRQGSQEGTCLSGGDSQFLAQALLLKLSKLAKVLKRSRKNTDESANRMTH